MRYPFFSRWRLRRKSLVSLSGFLLLLLAVNHIFRWAVGPGAAVVQDNPPNDVDAELKVEVADELWGQEDTGLTKAKEKAVVTEPDTPLVVDTDADGCAVLQCKGDLLSVSAYSSLDSAVVCVNGSPVVSRASSQPGLNIVQIDSLTGDIADVEYFDTGRHDDQLLVEYIESIPLGCTVVVAVSKEAALSLTPEGRAALGSLGSWKIDSVQVGWKWAMIGIKGSVSPSPYEMITPPPQLPQPSMPAAVGACLRLNDNRFREIAAHQLCLSVKGRTKFCKELGLSLPLDSVDNSTSKAARVENAVLMASTAPVVNFPQPALWDSRQTTDTATHLPIAIVAANRANYLIRSLKALFRQPGIKPHLITVYTDGVWEEMALVARVFGVRMAGHDKTFSNSEKNDFFKSADQITQHYKFSLGKIFQFHPEAEYAIVLEEDLEVAPDFLYYFSQSLHLLHQDSTLLSISAWNDNSYSYTSADPTKLYRSDFFPGLGWVLQKRIWQELEHKWPECCQGFSWDLWIRHKLIGKGRETVIPDVSRTFHFGRKGANVNNDFFFVLYFKEHSFNKDPFVRLSNPGSVLPGPYSAELHELFGRAKQVGRSNDTACPFYVPQSPPSENLYENVFVLWYKQLKGMKKFDNLESIVACLKMWDLGHVRGTYHGIIRAFYKGSHLLIAGDETEFAKAYMPANAYVVELPPKERRIPTEAEVEVVLNMRGKGEDI